MGDVEDLRERVAKLEAGQEWMNSRIDDAHRKIDAVHQKLDRIISMMTVHDRNGARLSWRVIAQLSAIIASLVGVVTFLVQRL